MSSKFCFFCVLLKQLHLYINKYNALSIENNPTELHGYSHYILYYITIKLFWKCWLWNTHTHTRYVYFPPRTLSPASAAPLYLYEGFIHEASIVNNMKFMSTIVEMFSIFHLTCINLFVSTKWWKYRKWVCECECAPTILSMKMQKWKRNKQQEALYFKIMISGVSLCVDVVFFWNLLIIVLFVRYHPFRNFPLRVEIREAYKNSLIPIHKIPIFYRDMQETSLEENSQLKTRILWDLTK